MVESVPEENSWAYTEIIKTFLTAAAAANGQVVIVTSGGTSVPLERNTVRSLENFSSGTRGAISAEEFIRQRETAWVVYFHRENPRCKMPFSVSLDADIIIRTGQGLEKMQSAIEEFARVKHRLLEVPFTTVQHYLTGLEALSRLSRHLTSPRVIFYLPAAVSDFYLPDENLAEHKI